MGVTKPVPVLVAVIGIGDTPEEQCAVWRELVGKRAFVLCPRGLPHWVKPGQQDEKDDETGDEPEPEPDAKPVQVGFYQPDATRLEKEMIRAAVAGAGIPIIAFPWTAAAAEAGFVKDGAYLIRPDGHLAWVDGRQDGEALRGYVERFAIRPRSAQK